MATAKRTEKMVSTDRIFLHHENPRHERYETQAQVIEWLCRKEEVAQLARDIAENGLSPFDRFGLIRDAESTKRNPTYIAAEGNRRLCALKLLTDPDLAPPEKRALFERLSENWTPISELPSVIFEDPDDLDLWLKRRHHGPAGGIGQKPWNADQKSRHSGINSRNRLALAFLDFAQEAKLISLEDRKRRLTTVQRFLSNPVMRETLGLDLTEPDKLSRNRPEEDFKKLVGQFMTDMLVAENPKVHSRQNSTSIAKYARELAAMKGLTNVRIDAEPIDQPESKSKKPRRRKPGKAGKPQALPWSSEIFEALNALGNWKLQNLYHSICAVTLDDHTPLIAVGVWSFFETLTARTGRESHCSFESYLNANKLAEYGLGAKRETGALRAALKRILDYGNTTKHHDTAAAFNGEQLANDVEISNPLILKLVKDVTP